MLFTALYYFCKKILTDDMFYSKFHLRFKPALVELPLEFRRHSRTHMLVRHLPVQCHWVCAEQHVIRCPNICLLIRGITG